MDLKELFKKFDISVADLAFLTGLSRSAIYFLKDGKRKNLSAETAVKIQLATKNKVTVADLIGQKNVKRIAKDIQKRLDIYEKES